MQPLLGTVWLGRSWRHLSSCGSTNDEAAAWALAGAPHGAVVVADHQERGRGRQGRVWHSESADSLYFSTVLRPPLVPMQVPPLTLCAGVAVAEALARFEVTPSLKWPNDLLIDGKKIAGILTEMSAADPRGRVDHVILGIGVNLNTETWPPELGELATSLRQARGGRSVDRAIFAATLCERLEHWYDRFISDGPSAVSQGWRRFAAFFGRRVRAGALEGVAESLDDDGALVLRLDDGQARRITSGEVHL